MEQYGFAQHLLKRPKGVCWLVYVEGSHYKVLTTNFFIPLREDQVILLVSSKSLKPATP